ncbi:hypothetical protein GCM10010399_76650 [Dactylosporangium fulvum]|uniref:Uncharacterized protein n=1 Tax=Dactylosporangium fulvum TaxID=53359 RepID=A0ABY5W5F2_9ACTN|nr:hypothetical protein [Dactylosporangium fulvum]UWP85142.1 hypothetical protein Dfulv_13290 [Dactylosporangium fulvum]
MNVNCGINGESRHVSQIFLCHHCGMPVCEEHGWVVVADDAFADSAAAPSALPVAPVPPGPTAHPAAAPPPGQLPPQPALRIAATVPRPAMHCRDCVDRFHKGAPKRHGWADPRPQAVGQPGPAGRP